MSNRREFLLYSGNKKIGQFSLTGDSDKYSIKLDDGLVGIEVPIDFMPEYFRDGQRYFKGPEVFEWIRDRVIPAGRQNINEILQKVGIEEYDELAIFLYAHGRSCRDYFHIEEIK